MGYGTYVGAQFLRATLTVVVPSPFGWVETTGQAWWFACAGPAAASTPRTTAAAANARHFMEREPFGVAAPPTGRPGPGMLMPSTGRPKPARTARRVRAYGSALITRSTDCST